MSKIIQTSITQIGDPFILPYDGTYYHYSTSAADGFLVYCSKDLVNWENKGYCYQNSKVGFQDFWAPEVYFYNNQFYMFFTSKNKDLDYLTVSVAIAKSPLGPFVDVDTTPTFNFGYPVIDASLLFDQEKVYMYFAKDCSKNIIHGVHTSQIYGVELTKDLLHIKHDPVLLLTPSTPFEQRDPGWQWNEAPSVLKHNDKYYLSYSSNCFSDKLYSVSYAVSNNPLDGFVKAIENPILTYIEGEISGPGHNAYFTTFDGELMTSFHVHTNLKQPSGDRRTCFSKYRFVNDLLVIDYLEEE